MFQHEFCCCCKSETPSKGSEVTGYLKHWGGGGGIAAFKLLQFYSAVTLKTLMMAIIFMQYTP